MNREEYLLSCLSEECAEVAQRACKAQRFGFEEVQPGQMESNRVRLVGEINDLLGVVSMLDLKGVGSKTAMQTKREKVESYLLYSKELGVLTEDGIGFDKEKK